MTSNYAHDSLHYSIHNFLEKACIMLHNFLYVLFSKLFLINKNKNLKLTVHLIGNQIPDGSNKIIFKNVINCFIIAYKLMSIRVSQSDDCSIRVYDLYIPKTFSKRQQNARIMISGITMKFYSSIISAPLQMTFNLAE